MKRPLSSRDRRALLVGVLLLVPSLGYVWGLKPYVAALTDARGRLAASREALARDLALVKLMPESRTLRLALDSVLRTNEARLFDAHDDGLAAAALSSYVTDLARAHQVWLQAATARPTQISPSGVRTLAIDVRAESDFQGMAAWLRALEEGPRLIRIDQLSLVPAADTTVSSHALQLRATVMGYALGEPPPVPKAKSASRKRP